MLDLRPQESCSSENTFFEITIVKNGNYTSKIFKSGVVVKFLSFSTDVKCYEEMIEGKKVHVIKGNNAEVYATKEDDNILIIGENNFIYHKGGKQNLVIMGTSNYIYEPARFDNSGKFEIRYKVTNNNEIIKNLENSNSMSNIIKSGNLWNIWNCVNTCIA